MVWIEPWMMTRKVFEVHFCRKCIKHDVCVKRPCWTVEDWLPELQKIKVEMADQKRNKK